MDGWTLEKIQEINLKLDYIIQEIQKTKQGDTEHGKKKEEIKGPPAKVQ